MMNWLKTTAPENRRFGIALFAGFLGGNVSSFVKWGTENPFPPRTPDRAIPPLEMLQDMGVNASATVYQYSEHVVNWGVAGIHHLFSIFFAMAYCFLAELFPQVKLWQGIAFSFLVTIGFHAVLLPTFNWAPPVWELPLDEIFSEVLGHALWMWTIEIFRRDIRNRMTGTRDAEFC